MSQSGTSHENKKSPLEAAQKIVTEMEGMTKEDQSLAIRFTIETLRLELVLPSPITNPPQQGLQQFNAPGLHTQVRDIKSFTKVKDPQSDQQFVAVVAYFYQFEAKPDERKNVIDPDTMKEAARLAGRPQVKRWAMTLTNAKNAGYLDSAGDGKYKLSSVGENLVAITLPDNANSILTKRNGTRNKQKKKKANNSKKGA